MDRDSFKASKQARKTMSQSEFDTKTSSEPMDGSAGQPKRYAHGSVQIAQACVAAIYDGNWKVMQRATDSDGLPFMLRVPQEHVVERIAATLESINASPHEPGRRSS
jgi:hypothetical protein